LVRTAASRCWWLVGGGAAIVVATVVLFWPCLSNGFIPYWDDDLYLTAAKAYQPVTWQLIAKLFVTVQEYYQPLTMLTFVVERTLVAENPAVAHGV